MLHEIAEWIVARSRQFGYGGIVALMALESSFFPFPSEVVMLPAGYLVSQGEMSLWICIALGIFGSLLGAWFNYFLAVKLGRPFLVKHGKYFFLSEKKLDKMDEFFKKHGEISMFSGRLIPGVRQLISFPAGLARMNLFRFSLYTALGAGIWVTILTVVGYLYGEHMEVAKDHLKPIITYTLAGILVLITGYVFWYHFRQKKRRSGTETDKG